MLCYAALDSSSHSNLEKVRTKTACLRRSDASLSLLIFPTEQAEASIFTQHETCAIGSRSSIPSSICCVPAWQLKGKKKPENPNTFTLKPSAYYLLYVVQVVFIGVECGSSIANTQQNI